MNEEISVEAANGAIDNLVKDIHKLQEPKTPTKEQIDYIRNQMDLLSTPLEDIPVIAIEIWERIRNQQ